MKTITQITCLFLISIACFSCEDILERAALPSEAEYLIPQGQHQSNVPMRMFNTDKIEVDVKFNPCAVYQTVDPVQQHSINKLIGFSDFGAHHHQHSARFGWKWINEQMEVHAYCYVNGERKEAFVGVAEIGKYHHLELHLQEDKYVFFMDNLPAVEIERANQSNSGNRYMLWPYFGGQETAPHDILIQMKHH